MLQRSRPPLILASASTARRTLLEGAGLCFTLAPAAIDEDAIKRRMRADGASAEAAAGCLADAKAREVASGWPEAVVIGADQILVCEDTWFDKPRDVPAAREQLRRLRGRTHTLATVAVCRMGQQRLWEVAASPRLTMRAFGDAFLEAYLAAEGDGLTGSVGAYRLEGRGVQLFSGIEGDHATILGLPLLPLLAFLREHGLLLD